MDPKHRLQTSEVWPPQKKKKLIQVLKLNEQKDSDTEFKKHRKAQKKKKKTIEEASQPLHRMRFNTLLRVTQLKPICLPSLSRVTH